MTPRRGLRQFFFEDPFWLEARAYSKAEAWLDIVEIMAAYRPKKYTAEEFSVTLRRGEFVGSVRFLATRWSWSRETTHRFLKHCLETRRLVGRQVGHRVGQPSRVYLVADYDSYWGTTLPDGTRDGTPDGTKIGQVLGPSTPTGVLVNGAEKSAQPTLVARCGDLWKSLRGMPSYPRIGRMLKGIASEGSARIYAAWEGYLEERQGKPFATPEDFAANFGVYAERYAYVLGEQGERIPIPREAA